MIFLIWQMVRKFKSPLIELLESGNIDLCFANEDEATELLRLLFVFALKLRNYVYLLLY